MNKWAKIAGLGLLGLAIYYAVTHRKAKAAPPPTVTVDLVPGLQDVVFQGETRPIAGAFAGIADKIIAVWYYDEATGTWLGYSPTVPEWANDLTELVKGQTYSINASAACQWAYII
jgi:hypothetical protein